MADPLSFTASLVSIIAAALQASKSLCAAVESYKKRDKTLNRLYEQLTDLINILASLEAAIGTEAAVLKLLEAPIGRCTAICKEFEVEMAKFKGKSKLPFIDWAKMEFMAGDINGFMDNISNYKSTIMIGMGTIAMQRSKLQQDVLQGYSEKIEDTIYDLNVNLIRIDEKLTRMAAGSPTSSDTSIDLQDEKEVTNQCIRVCQKAREYIEILQAEHRYLLQGGTPTTGASSIVQTQFEAQVRTSEALNESNAKFAETIAHLYEQLASVVSNKGPERDREMLQLQEDINISKQCLEVCKQASAKVSYQKIHQIGEVVADSNTDQVVITTLADLFDVRKVLAKDHSAQLVGSMSDASLQQMSKDRYGSRFGAVRDKSDHVRVGETASPSVFEAKDINIQPSKQTKKEKQQQSPEKKGDKPSPNEMRKRASGNDSENRD